MKRPITIRTAMVAALMATTLVAAACGTSVATDVPASTTSSIAATHDHDAGSMNMGDADEPMASSIDGAELTTGIIEPLVSNAQATISGTADLARHDGGTTVTVMLKGLEPGATYIAHVHADVCANAGGPHYQFEVGGDHYPPNEIHLAFTAGDDGSGHMTANNDAVADNRAVSIVVHRAIDGAPKLACADLS